MKHVKTTLTALLILFLLVPACSRKNLIESSLVLDESSRKLLRETTEAINFDYGFHTEFDVFFVFPASTDSKVTAAREKELAGKINAVELSAASDFYTRVVRLQMCLDHKIAFFLKNKDWKNYTYFNNYLLPPMETYRAHVKNALASRDASQLQYEDDREKRGRRWALWYYRNYEEALDTFP